MDLGVFSVSLAVADLDVSREFYEKLGFAVFTDTAAQNYLIMKNGDTIIGLFHGMFTGNILTFNPGWDANAQPVGTFTDVREIQRSLTSDGLALVSAADETTTGPASCMLVDPDGNMILLDQHL